MLLDISHMDLLDPMLLKLLSRRILGPEASAGSAAGSAAFNEPTNAAAVLCFSFWAASCRALERSSPPPPSRPSCSSSP